MLLSSRYILHFAATLIIQILQLILLSIYLTNMKFTFMVIGLLAAAASAMESCPCHPNCGCVESHCECLPTTPPNAVFAPCHETQSCGCPTGDKGYCQAYDLPKHQALSGSHIEVYD